MILSPRETMTHYSTLPLQLAAFHYQPISSIRSARDLTQFPRLSTWESLSVGIAER